MSTVNAVNEAMKIIDAVKAENAGAAEVEKLKACLMVMDATIYCIAPFVGPQWVKELFAGQIQCAKEAYEHATGEESMIGLIREKR